MLAWPDLERGRHALHTDSISSGAMIRALGYMMEGDRPIHDGDRVQAFVLLPDAGNIVHPAHRFGDGMIDVRLKAGSTARFSERSLVWVWGTLRMLPGDPLGHSPLYVLEHARTEPASKTDIQRYFKWTNFLETGDAENHATIWEEFGRPNVGFSAVLGCNQAGRAARARVLWPRGRIERRWTSRFSSSWRWSVIAACAPNRLSSGGAEQKNSVAYQRLLFFPTHRCSWSLPGRRGTNLGTSTGSTRGQACMLARSQARSRRSQT
jgi:hypothetical protein